MGFLTISARLKLPEPLVGENSDFLSSFGGGEVGKIEEIYDPV